MATSPAAKQWPGVDGALIATTSTLKMSNARRRSFDSMRRMLILVAAAAPFAPFAPKGSASVPRPRSVAFDLDGCLWRPSLAQLRSSRSDGLAFHCAWPDVGGAPFSRRPDNTLRDRRSERVALYDGVLPALACLSDRWHGATLAVASCCQAFEFDGRPLAELLGLQIFGRGSKRKHLRQIAAYARCRLSELLFFDNEPGHCRDAAELGVTAVLCPRGLTREVWTVAEQQFPRPGTVIVEKLVRFLHLKAETQQADKAQALLWRCAAEGRAVHPFGALSAAEVRRAIAKFEQKKEPKEDAPVEAPKDVLSLSRGKARPQVVKDLALYLRSQTPKRRCNSEQMLRVAAERRWQVAGIAEQQSSSQSRAEEQQWQYEADSVGDEGDKAAGREAQEETRFEEPVVRAMFNCDQQYDPASQPQHLMAPEDGADSEKLRPQAEDFLRYSLEALNHSQQSKLAGSYCWSQLNIARATGSLVLGHLTWQLYLLLNRADILLMASGLEMPSAESSLLPRDLSEVQKDIEATVQSEMMLFESLLGKSIDASGFRERIQGAWSMIGMVGALTLTMDQYNEPVTCPKDVSSHVFICQYVHPLLAACSTIFAAASVLLSMILYVEMSFVPDEFLGPWMRKLSWAVESPLLCFIIGIICWALDFLWRGALQYGNMGYAVAAMVVVVGIGVLIMYLKLKAMTNKFLLQAAASAAAA
ncbi:unnamed protein product [Effrenium voratum]|uniref:Magnesium-dependent phosphatase 1 n=1 Tax=Effrenium voratum TaxID=2562239 RepID=A0AA36I8A2_9DINO|nr:unnamed protein product [Effrenium voratum]